MIAQWTTLTRRDGATVMTTTGGNAFMPPIGATLILMGIRFTVTDVVIEPFAGEQQGGLVLVDIERAS